MGQSNSGEMPEADSFGWGDATGRLAKPVMFECVILTWNQESQHYRKECSKFHREKYISIH